MRPIPSFLAVVVALVIAAASLTPAPLAGPATGPIWLPYMKHGAAYLALAAACFLARKDSPNAYRYAIAAAVGYGAVIELLQIPVPGRTFAVLDLAANTAGAAAVLLNEQAPVLVWIEQWLP